ncbi:hypothetical protein AOLI_G00133990 [Acnodon oligacanthus]
MFHPDVNFMIKSRWISHGCCIVYEQQIAMVIGRCLQHSNKAEREKETERERERERESSEASQRGPGVSAPDEHHSDKVNEDDTCLLMFVECNETLSPSFALPHSLACRLLMYASGEAT